MYKIIISVIEERLREFQTSGIVECISLCFVPLKHFRMDNLNFRAKDRDLLLVHNQNSNFQSFWTQL